MPNDQDPPNSNPSNTNQVTGNNPPPTPSEDVPFPVNDLPPLSDTVMPIESQVMANAPQTPGTPPPFDIPPVVTPLTKKGWSGGKIVGAVLGLLLLVGGIGAGVLLVRQNQDIREKASTMPGCSAVSGNLGQCVASDTSCTGTNYGAVDCGTGRKCAVSCTTPPPAANECQPGQQQTENCAVGAGVNGTRTRTCSEARSWGTWDACVPGNTLPSSAPSSAPNTCTANGGNCYNAAGGCVSIGKTNVTAGSCTGGQVCCSDSVGGGGGGGGGSCGGCDGQPDGFKGGCNANQGGKQGTCSCNTWTYAYSAACPDPNAGGGTTGPTCPNDASKPIAKYVKFTCPGGCTQTTEDGVTAYRCYQNRVDSNSPLSLDGACGQVDALSGSADSSYCGYTQYTCGEARCQGGGGTPTSTPAGSATLAASCNAGITGTGIPAGISTVHLYFDSGPEDYTSSGGTGKAAAKQVTVTNGSFNYSLKTASNLLIPKETGGNVNLGDGAAHKIRAFAINSSTNPELVNSGLSLNLTGSSCIGDSGTPIGPTCQQVLAYDTNWAPLNATQLSNLKPGNKVRFTISGTRSTGIFTKARFKVNQTAAVEVTGKKPGQTEVFFYEYTIPANVTTFNITAAIYHDSRGWVPAIIN